MQPSPPHFKPQWLLLCAFFYLGFLSSQLQDTSIVWNHAILQVLHAKSRVQERNLCLPARQG